jgi:hypothetical protein
VSNFLDVHAAFGGGHHGDLLGGAVGQRGDVVFFDVGAFLDQQVTHLLAFRAGLVGDQLHAEDLPAYWRTSSSDLATLTPPPLPRPPAWIWALTTQTLPPRFPLP